MIPKFNLDFVFVLGAILLAAALSFAATVVMHKNKMQMLSTLENPQAVCFAQATNTEQFEICKSMGEK
jgi:hypothetical protein